MHNELRNGIRNSNINRRTVVKVLGAGVIGSVAATGKVAGQADDKYELSQCISADDDGNVVEVEGAGFFDSSGSGSASGGGPFEFRDDEGGFQAAGRWEADSTEHWHEFGRNARGAVGGHLELGITFNTLQGTFQSRVLTRLLSIA